MLEYKKEEREYELKRKISNFLLNKLKMQYTSIGFNYWINAIAYYISLKQEDRYAPIQIKNIYQYLAEKYDTSKSNVEKAMRYAKEKSNYIVELNLDHRLKNKEFLVMFEKMFLE